MLAWDMDSQYPSGGLIQSWQIFVTEFRVRGSHSPLERKEAKGKLEEYGCCVQVKIIFLRKLVKTWRINISYNEQKDKSQSISLLKLLGKRSGEKAQV